MEPPKITISESNRQKVVNNLGDILWFVVIMADVIGVSLEEIVANNINKLEKKYPNVFLRNKQ